ncbi:TIGR03759 family integrating conjugative element protein [Zophobihabitans entericus]|uniref:TIGR03759 family integrating conjugative element protein n=1 Tax=Zophobihabitans entericus TaxID=1635327 RepID=A0A6G9IEZ0_9GAMM|nr:TIGR03759 family integrating conjugative element protein [Zophobihabitans entericus]QIQ22160.1 TIGR03759 family integrating conjugative element protein [Zophobihabitans entericus]
MLQIKPKYLLFVFLAWTLVFGQGLLNQAVAQNNSQSNTSYSQVQLTQEQTQKASDWGLKKDEWLRYEQLMRGPIGIYSPNLDPLTVLGIEARTETERRYFAELQVKAESNRVQKELAYQRAYDEAFARLYPNLMPISDGMTDTPSTSSNIPSRLAVFVKDNCIACDSRVKQLQSNNQEFDIYLVGSRNNDKLVRDWANRIGIDTQKVKAGVITLNHDGGRWVQLGIGGDLPAIVKEVNGQWQRQ